MPLMRLAGNIGEKRWGWLYLSSSTQTDSAVFSRCPLFTSSFCCLPSIIIPHMKLLSEIAFLQRNRKSHWKKKTLLGSRNFQDHSKLIWLNCWSIFWPVHHFLQFDTTSGLTQITRLTFIWKLNNHLQKFLIQKWLTGAHSPQALSRMDGPQFHD